MFFYCEKVKSCFLINFLTKTFYACLNLPLLFWRSCENMHRTFFNYNGRFKITALPNFLRTCYQHTTLLAIIIVGS